MPTIITTQVLPDHTVKLTITFLDEDGSAVVPDDPCTWSLTDSTGSVVNSRSGVDITEASSVDIVLTDADLSSTGVDDDGVRLFSVDGTHTAGAYSLDKEYAFVIGDVLLPVTLGDAKRNLNIDIDNTTDDYLLCQYITAARQEVERVLDRKLMTQTVTEYFDDWPSGRSLILPYGQLQSVTSLSYRDEDGNWQTVSTSDYVVETEDEPGRIVLDDDASWPSETLYESKPIRVVYVCGYGSLAGSVPMPIRRNIMLMVNEAYESRDPVIVGSGIIVKRIYDPLKSLTYAYGVFGVR